MRKLAYLAQALRATLIPDTWQTLEHCDVMLVRHDWNCGYTYDGKAYAQLSDSFGELFGKRGLVTRSVARPYSRLIGALAYGLPVSFNRVAFINSLLRRILWVLKDRTYSTEWNNKRNQDIWCKILERAKPRYVIGIQPDVGLCRAGKMKKIPVYDLQHGVINDDHNWYGKKFRIDTPPSDLPDGFLCWDEPSAMALRKWVPDKGIDVRIIGNPWFMRFSKMDQADKLVQDVINTGRIFNNEKITILVSLQWGLHEFYYKNVKFNGVIVDALEQVILETAGDYNWLLRLHPVQLRGSEKEKALHYLAHTFGYLTSVEWHKSSELPLPIVLQQTDLHITDMSTVVIEAAWMGLQSALLNNNICPGGSLEKMYEHERSLGLATVLPQDVHSIKRWIEDALPKRNSELILCDYSNALNEFIEGMKSFPAKAQKYL